MLERDRVMHAPDPLDADPIARMARIAERALSSPADAPMRLADLRALRARYATDFLSFVKLLEILPKEGGRVRFEPNEIQTAYNAARTPRDVVLKSRQVGLTTEEQARDLWYWLMRDGVRVVAVCQTGNSARP